MPSYTKIRERLELKDDEPITHARLQKYFSGCKESEEGFLDHLQRTARNENSKVAVRGVMVKWVIIMKARSSWEGLLGRWPKKTCNECGEEGITVYSVTRLSKEEITQRKAAEKDKEQKDKEQKPKSSLLYCVKCSACNADYRTKGAPL